MSSSMFWRPVPKEVPPGQWVPDDLRHKLGKRLWDSYSDRNEAELDKTNLPYLDGLADGGVEGAAELVAAILEHGRVRVWIGYADER
jgi:hypothetical protein